MTRLALISLVCLSFASAHRLDEYLQATTISLQKDRVQAQIRLTPGVAVYSSVMALIDTDRDGAISSEEERGYARRVLDDLSLTVDGDHPKLKLVSTTFPEVGAIKEGLGEIQIDFAADVGGHRFERRLVFENHHQAPIASYLVNCLIPSDPDIRVTRQNRNFGQSVYQLDYLQRGSQSSSTYAAWLAGVGGLMVAWLAIWTTTRACRDRSSLSA